MEFAVGLRDRMFVDAGEPQLHKALGVELPILVAIGSKPLAAIVVIFISESDGNTVASIGPQFLDKAITKLARPFAR